MICSPCRTQNCLDCQSPDCYHSHKGSPVRPLTNAERVEYATGRRTEYLVLREPLEAPGERTPPAQEDGS